MKENFGEKKTDNFKYEIVNDGDGVWVSGGGMDDLLEKACEIYFGLEESEPLDFLKKQTIEDLKSGQVLRPNGFGISLNLEKKELLIMNQNARGHQPNRDLMKKVIGY